MTNSVIAGGIALLIGALLWDVAKHAAKGPIGKEDVLGFSVIEPPHRETFQRAELVAGMIVVVAAAIIAFWPK